MKIIVNGLPREVTASHLEAVLLELEYGDARIATAVNGEFVPQTLRPATTLADNDRLEILAPMQGG